MSEPYEPFGPGVDLHAVHSSLLLCKLGELYLEYRRADQWRTQNKMLLQQQAAPGKVDGLAEVVREAQADCYRLASRLSAISDVLEERRRTVG